MERRDSFEEIAELYSEVRQGYPEALYDLLESRAGLNRSAAVLEVGCGAGQASVDLARRCRRLVAIDPGMKLLESARRRCRGDHLTFVLDRFETFEANQERFDLLISAQAWHWVDPAVGVAKAAELLKPEGSVAVFGHVPEPPSGPLAAAFEAAFEKYAPGVWGKPPAQATYLPDGPFGPMFNASGLFEPAGHFAFPWTWTIDPQTFGKYLRTDSGYRFLPEPDRFALFDQMTEAVMAEGGTIELAFESHLHLARKRQAP